MTTHRHIVQVHPVENGVPNSYKVMHEAESDTKKEAEAFVQWYNNEQCTDGSMKAMYHGRVNDQTGELE